VALRSRRRSHADCGHAIEREHLIIRARIAWPARFGGQSHSTGYDGGIRPCKRTRDAVVDWRHSTNSRHFARFFFFSRFDKP